MGNWFSEEDSDDGFNNQFTIIERMVDSREHIFVGLVERERENKEINPISTQCIRRGMFNNKINRLIFFEELSYNLIYVFENNVHLTINKVFEHINGEKKPRIIINYTDNEISISKEMNDIVRRTYKRMDWNKYTRELDKIYDLIHY